MYTRVTRLSHRPCRHGAVWVQLDAPGRAAQAPVAPPQRGVARSQPERRQLGRGSFLSALPREWLRGDRDPLSICDATARAARHRRRRARLSRLPAQQEQHARGRRAAPERALLLRTPLLERGAPAPALRPERRGYGAYARRGARCRRGVLQRPQARPLHRQADARALDHDADALQLPGRALARDAAIRDHGHRHRDSVVRHGDERRVERKDAADYLLAHDRARHELLLLRPRGARDASRGRRPVLH